MAFLEGKIPGNKNNDTGLLEGTSVIAGDLSLEGNIYAKELVKPDLTNLYIKGGAKSIANRLIKYPSVPSTEDADAEIAVSIVEEITKEVNKSVYKFLQNKSLPENIKVLNFTPVEATESTNIAFSDSDLHIGHSDEIHLDAAIQDITVDSSNIVMLYEILESDLQPGDKFIKLKKENSQEIACYAYRGDTRIKLIPDIACYESLLTIKG